jgi:predicted peroxiredoxin
MRRLRFLLLTTALVVTGALLFVRADACVAATTQDGVFIHVSHGADDPHRLLMAFKMAVTMAEAGHPVLVYCDIKAVSVLAAGAADVTHDLFPSAHTQLQRMLELGVRVRACPTCLKVAGLGEDRLVKGVKLADKDEFFGFASGRILSLDY